MAIVSIISSAVVAVAAIIGLVWSYFRELGDIKQRLTTLETKTEPFWKDDWFSKRGINIDELGSNRKSGSHNSLPPIKAAERDALVARGKEFLLTQAEATRLKELLEEDARNDFANGVFSFLAFVAVLALIGAIVKSLSKS